MAVNLLNSDDIEITQTGDDIQLSTTTPISTILTDINTNTTNIQKINDSEVYSTSEVETNKTWVNGKKIYRKSFIVDLTSTSMNVPHDISNFETILLNESMSIYKKNNIFIPLNYFYSTSDYSRVIVNNTDIQIRNTLSGTISDWTAYITLEYTKTS